MVSSFDILQGKILIVDDQETNVLLLERMLGGAGYVSITSTMDPGEVCPFHCKNRYDLILLDLQMPGMDGFQVMAGLKEIEPGDYFPVLVITAQPGHKLRALQAGAKDFMSKPGNFTPDEWEIMKGHTSMGAKILGNSRSPYLRMGAEIALNHHERWDGGGYPNGKRGESIPLSARIMNICDIYDALRSKRPYKPAFDHLKTVEIIVRGDGHTQPEHFDPAIHAAFRQNHQSFRDIFETCTA